MEDKYLYFTFNNINSSTYNCFYINNGEDLVFPVFPQFSDQKSSPLFQQHSYYLGTSIEDKTFSLECACDNITIKTFRQLQKWLNIETIGELKFDWLANFHYNVKVSNFSNITILPQYTNVSLAENIPFSCTFTVEFTTIEDYAAISDTKYEFDTLYGFNGEHLDLMNGEELVDDGYKLPLVDYDPDTSKQNPDGRRIRLFNAESYPYYITVSSDKATGYKLTISSESNGEDKEWYKYGILTTRLKLEIESKLGYVSGDDGTSVKLIERYFQDNQELQSSFINEGPFAVPPSILYQSQLKLISVSKRPVDGTSGNLRTYAVFEIPSEDLIYFSNGKWVDENTKNYLTENTGYDVVCLQPPGVTQYSLYNRNGYGEGLYYVNELHNHVTYRYGINNYNQLVVAVQDIESTEENRSFYDECFAALYGHYPNSEEPATNVHKEFLVSIMKYLEIDTKTQNDQNQVNNHITFHLRTVF